MELANRLRIPLLALVAAGGIGWTVGCGDGGTEPPPEPPRPATLTVAPASAELAALGATLRFLAEVRDQNGQTLTGEAVGWSSSDPSVAPVDVSGLATAASNGSATITATAGSISSTATVTVAQVVSAVAVSPAEGTLVEADTLRLSAEAADANGHAVEVAEFVWASSDTLAVQVDTSGLVAGVASGLAVVTATASDVTGYAELRVVPPLPTSIAVTPDTVQFTAFGQTVQLTADVWDQALRPMPEAVVFWSSGDMTVAAVDASGIVTASGGGTTMVTATAGETAGGAVVTVMQSARSVVVSPDEAVLGPGDTLRLAAEAFDENGHRVNGAVFSWSSRNASVARVDASGLITGVAEGTARIMAALGDVGGTAEITIENPDRAALVALYEATDGPSWATNENWLTDVPLGEWYGVEVSNFTGRVTKLSLRDNRLAGPIPAELEGLAHLEWLNLGTYFLADNRNWLEGPIPAELGNMTRLQWLDLSSHGPRQSCNAQSPQLTGDIPPELGRLRRLRHLDISGSGLGGPIPPELANLTQLEWLDLRCNFLTGALPPALAKLARMKRLLLGYNRLTGPIPPEFGDLLSLEWLSLDGNYLTGAIPALLSNLSNLRLLSLDGNDFTGEIPSELGNLARLESLSIGGRGLTGRIPPELGNLSRLRYLLIGDPYADLTGGIPPTLGNLANLEVLILKANLTGEIPPEIGRLAKLTHLWLSDNDLTGEIPPQLGNLNNLEEFILGAVPTYPRVRGGNLLTGPVPPEIGKLAKLRYLWLSDNPRLEGPLPLSLTALDALEAFFAEKTGLCAPLSAAFQTWLVGLAHSNVQNCPTEAPALVGH